MPITFNSQGGFLQGTISSSDNNIFITTSGSAGSINVGNVEYTGSQVIEKDSAGKVRNKKTFNTDGTITQEKFDQNEIITETKVKDPSKGKEFIRSGSATSNQIEFQQNAEGANIIASGSNPGFTAFMNDIGDRAMRPRGDVFASGSGGGLQFCSTGVAMNGSSLDYYIQMNHIGALGTTQVFGDSNGTGFLMVSQSGDTRVSNNLIVDGDISATSLNVTSITSSIVTSSIFQTEGSNIFGDAITDTQTFNGHITASGNISSSGNIIADGIKATLPAGVDNSVVILDSDGFLKTDEIDPKVFDAIVGNSGGGNIGSTHDNKFPFIDDGDNNTLSGDSNLKNVSGGVEVTGDLKTTSHITASNNISASGTIVGSNLSGTNTGDQDLSSYLQNSDTGSMGDLTVSGELTSDTIVVGSTLTHNGDSDTKITFNTDDINLTAAGKTAIDITYDGDGGGDTREITFNEGHADIDVRIEGDTDANLFFTNAGTERVGIGTNSPTEKLSVSGSINVFGEAGHITASGNISSSGDLISKELYLDNAASIRNQSTNVRLRFGTPNDSSELKLLSGHLNVASNITASGNISGSNGNILGFNSASLSSIETSGNITLGGASTKTLSIGSTTHGSQIILDSDVTSRGKEIKFLSGGSTKHIIEVFNGNMGIGGSDSSDTIISISGSGNTNGKVGINTPNSSTDVIPETLTVEGNISASGHLNVATHANMLDVKHFAYYISSTGNGDTKYFLPLNSLSENTVGNPFNRFFAPYDGVFKKVIFYARDNDPGNTTVSFHTGSAAQVTGDEVQSITIGSAVDDTSYEVNFSSSICKVNKGDFYMVAIQGTNEVVNYWGGTWAIEYDTST